MISRNSLNSSRLTTTPTPPPMSCACCCLQPIPRQSQKLMTPDPITGRRSIKVVFAVPAVGLATSALVALGLICMDRMHSGS